MRLLYVVIVLSSFLVHMHVSTSMACHFLVYLKERTVMYIRTSELYLNSQFCPDDMSNDARLDSLLNLTIFYIRMNSRVADPEGVQGVRSNPETKLKLFYFHGCF